MTRTRVPEHRKARGLLDTSVVIDIELLSPSQLPVEVAISAITMAELAAAPHAATDPDERGRDQAAGGIGYPTMNTAAQEVVQYLSTGQGPPPNGWLAQDLLGFNESGCTWQETGGEPPITATTLTFAQSCNGMGVVSVVNLTFREYGSLFWYAGVALSEGH